MTARMQAWAVQAQLRLRTLGEDDRGDVPGWVLVTLMTAGLVSVLWFVAGNALQQLFQDAVMSVSPRSGL
ncbi:hypothetical protein [Cellulomonas oligotrophica]|uniref:Uncharacterized protein n=1 Tax=Cellulomonas oligotrophica TaxID=931536 RepID=A0A7Y9FKN0_9CELL|nr:hypothetical protein [Cellulomonas oligotrophica]NYD87811.1 hypothetical protein [Cellulomonas oligotrophica]GIG32984.1 hypothetical protein Col01nite_21430 [Cellulomonas oligotrophica]